MLNEFEGEVLLRSLNNNKVSPEAYAALGEKKIFLIRSAAKQRKAVAKGFLIGLLASSVLSASAAWSGAGKEKAGAIFFACFLSISFASHTTEKMLREESAKELANINYLLEILEVKSDV